MFLMWFLGMRRLTPSFQIFFERSSAREGRRYAHDDTLWAGMRGTPFPGQAVGLCNLLTRFPGRFTEYVLLALKLKIQGRTIPKISGTISKISGTISKLASAPERKRP